jgi:hypothetical protein
MHGTSLLALLFDLAATQVLDMYGRAAPPRPSYSIRAAGCQPDRAVHPIGPQWQRPGPPSYPAAVQPDSLLRL